MDNNRETIDRGDGGSGQDDRHTAGTKPVVQVVTGASLFAELYQALTEQRCRLIVECGDGPRLAVISEGALADLEGRGLASPQEVRLTQRELEVLALAATGHISDNIAAELGIARNTVAQHLAMVRRKLGVRTTSAAVEYARRAGLLR